MSKRSPVTVLVWGFYSQTPFTNYKNNITNTIIMGQIRKKTKKWTKKSKSQNSITSEQWRKGKNLQATKISQVVKFRNPAPFLLLALCFSFLLVFDLQL